MSVNKQIKILWISRSFLYNKKQAKNNKLDEELMLNIDKIYTDKPFYGTRRIKMELKNLWYLNITRYKVWILMKKMWIKAIYPHRKTSIWAKEHKIYPYLLKWLKIKRINQVRSTDITYIKMKRWWIYLVAIIDWYSRKILSWKISNSIDISFCIEALKEALQKWTPEIFNTDQGSQFTSKKFISILKEKDVKISMDWVWRCLDNIYIERFWRSLKQENIYINKYESMIEAYHWIAEYIEFYNKKRGHQAINYKTPEEIWRTWTLKM